MCVTIQRKQLCIWICIYNKSTVSAHICCRSLKQKSLKHVSMSSMLYIYFYIHIHFMKIYVDQFDTAYKIIKNIRCNISYEENGSKNHSVVSDSSWPHGLYSSWNSSRQNTGMGSCSLLQGIFLTQGSNPSQVSCIEGGVFTSWATRAAQY